VTSAVPIPTALVGVWVGVGVVAAAEPAAAAAGADGIVTPLEGVPLVKGIMGF